MGILFLYFQLHARYPDASKHKRNLVIAGGVSASILVSPILAGFAVGKYRPSGIIIFHNFPIHRVKILIVLAFAKCFWFWLLSSVINKI